MPTQTIVLPLAFGAARVLEWLVAAGDTVTPATPVVRILAGDAEWVLPAQCEGVVTGPLVEIGAQVVAGTILAYCNAPRRMRMTPLARRLATALGVDLTTLTGSGPGGRIGRADVLAAVVSDAIPGRSQPAPEAITESALIEATPIHSAAPVLPSENPIASDRDSTPAVATASRLQLFLTDLIPLASATIAIDVQPLLRHRAAQAAEFAARGLESTPLSALIAAAAALFPRHPLLNATWTDSALVVRHRYHVAAGLPDGRWALIPDAGDLTERGVARALTRADADLRLATCAITTANDWWQIAPPLPGTAAALTLSAAHPQPIARDETTIVVGAVAHLSLCYDARVLDHLAAMAFLNDLCRRLGLAMPGSGVLSGCH